MMNFLPESVGTLKVIFSQYHDMFSTFKWQRGNLHKSCKRPHVMENWIWSVSSLTIHFFFFTGWIQLSYCCGASVASEQQHIQNLRRIYIKGRPILELSTFYQNALHLSRIHCATFTRVHCATNNSNKQQRHEEIHRGVLSTVPL